MENIVMIGQLVSKGRTTNLNTDYPNTYRGVILLAFLHWMQFATHHQQNYPE